MTPLNRDIQWHTVGLDKKLFLRKIENIFLRISFNKCLIKTVLWSTKKYILAEK